MANHRKHLEELIHETLCAMGEIARERFEAFDLEGAQSVLNARGKFFDSWQKHAEVFGLSSGCALVGKKAFRE